MPGITGLEEAKAGFKSWKGDNSPRGKSQQKLWKAKIALAKKYGRP